MSISFAANRLDKERRFVYNWPIRKSGEEEANEKCPDMPLLCLFWPVF